MRISDVTAVLTALERANVRHWVAGGWGVAVLVGRQTRQHRDLDLAVHADDMAACVSALTDLGYVTETDWRDAESGDPVCSSKFTLVINVRPPKAD